MLRPEAAGVMGAAAGLQRHGQWWRTSAVTYASTITYPGLVESHLSSQINEPIRTATIFLISDI